MIAYFLKTIRLIIDTLSFSYFIGMGWLILCKITYFYNNIRSDHFDYDDHHIMSLDQNFFPYFEFK